MKRCLLDTSALLTLRDNEAGADQVAGLLYQAQNGQADCLACFMTLMELLYRVWKDEGETAGRLAYEQAQALPITWIHEDRPLLEKAAELKARYAISLADAWIGAAAILNSAELVHKDPKFASLPCQQAVLPYK
ncbi:MAG: PIN domain-containing protein [Chloroflexota bacterium]